MVVAHPDDEILWGGGLLLRYPGDWTVIACSIPRKDPVRAYCFFRVCEALGAKGRLLPQWETTDNNDPNKLIVSLDRWTNGLEEFDRIVTHGSEGEYGHEQHKQIHDYVMHFAKGRPVTTFGYGKGQHLLLLNDKEVQRKLTAFKKYDFIREYGGRLVPAWEALMDINYNHPRVPALVKLEKETYGGDWFD